MGNRLGIDGVSISIQWNENVTVILGVCSCFLVSVLYFDAFIFASNPAIASNCSRFHHKSLA
jgi:hypothetical protein